MPSHPSTSISKTDYKAARSCPAKLYYRLKKYPTTKDGDAYLELLAEGGYIIGAIASLLFENAVLVDERDHDNAAALTQEYFKQENIILLEAAFESQGKFARPDILIKQGEALTLIEVKARAFDASQGNPLRGKRGGIASEWKPYLEDIAFQALLLRELHPRFTLRCELMLPDKNKTTRINNLRTLFVMNPLNGDGHGYPQARFTFTGDVNELQREHFLTRLQVDAEVEELFPNVSADAARYVHSINPLSKLPAPLSFACKDCEYRVDHLEERNGFRECWGELADPEPHILDLYHGGQVKAVQALIDSGRTGLLDLPESALIGKDSSPGPRTRRQLIQIRHTRSQTEWIDPALKGILSSHPYPLHFIDFETSGLAVPVHAGMRPFETIAFQWSCHTLPGPGAQPIHYEWINLEDAFPNFAFAESLMEHLGRSGTVYMWATHENSILRQIRVQMDGRYENSQLAEWLDWITAGRLVDMNDLTLKHYFHPLMKGRTSIKKVLDAVWQINKGLRTRNPRYIKEENGKLLSPHKALPPLEINGRDAYVNEGTSAITAYQAMLSAPQTDHPADREHWKNLLLEYCELDTLAMVMIYEHWQEKLTRL